MTIGVLSVSLLALTACTQPGGNDPEPERPESDGSNLPFALPGNDESDPTPTQTSEPDPTPSSSSNGGGESDGTDTISFDGADVTETSWEVICSPDATGTYRVNASNDNGGYLYVLVDTEGKFERFEFAPDDGTSTVRYWYWVNEHEGESTALETSGPDFKDDKVTITGQTYEYDDFDYAKPISYDVTLTCDTTN
ncbi:hypothetical protein [Gulosibacter sp. ACHW.36C]|uniref:Lipoprotein n=1 Tax=Gulosibacter sediminis TaxID=1729695 RepID=A0ABY4MYL8_9MICO|nr:hypothetical protein [Gulosibacter sediminis]UQN15530.1 hypothetical protein M3M28_03460 [Gulosibacter sediminis]